MFEKKWFFESSPTGIPPGIGESKDGGFKKFIKVWVSWPKIPGGGTPRGRGLGVGHPTVLARVLQKVWVILHGMGELFSKIWQEL